MQTFKKCVCMLVFYRYVEPISITMSFNQYLFQVENAKKNIRNVEKIWMVYLFHFILWEIETIGR